MAADAPRHEKIRLRLAALGIRYVVQEFLSPRKDEASEDGFEHSTHWAHATTALFVFASDFLKPLVSLCTVWLATGAFLLAIFLALAIKYRIISTRSGYSFLVFCSITAVLSLLMVGLQEFIGDKDGALASLFPGIERLQKNLGVIDQQLNAVKRDTEAVLKGQEQAEARAEARHKEAMAALGAACGTSATTR